MSSAAINTIVKMLESLSSDLQEQVAEHITDLEDEAQWESSFKKSQHSLVAAARQAKQEIAEGRSMPMDYEQL